MTLVLSRMAVQFASHNRPRLIRLLVEPGMMWPRRASGVGIVGNGRSAVADELIRWPVAVLIVVRWPVGLMLSTGAVGMK